ncbi:MAG: sugar ABC transporter permease [Actinomycetota bacterium]|nr:sugar ABC transporter permease [Actinomycetota bacterium]
MSRPARSSLGWPYLTGLFLLVALPLVGAIALAFTEFSGIGSPEYVGFDNFTRLWEDSAFWRSLGNSLVFVLLSVPLRLGAAVAFALLLHRRSRGAASGRIAAYLPTVIPDVAYALLWLWLLNPLYGPLALAVGAVGVDDVLTDPWGARIGVAVMGAFQIGEAFIVALAARRTIPESLYEAAAVDGASRWFTFRKLTLPLMAPILGLLALRDVILSFQINFVPALLVTEGGPRYATTYLPLYAYRQAFRYFRLGYASAMTLTMFVLTAAIVYVQYRMIRRWRAL